MAEDFTLKGKIVLDTDGLKKPTEETKGLTSEFENLFGGVSSTTIALGGLAAGAIGASLAIHTLTEDAYEAYCEFDRLGWAIGISAGEMAKWNQVAIYSDSSGSALATMLGKMSVNLSDTGAAGDKARLIFKELGVSVYGVDGNVRPLTDLFPEFIEGLKDVTSTAERNGAAMDIVGRGYKELAGYAILGADGIREVLAETNTLSQVQQKQLGDLEESWKDFNRSMDESKMLLGAELAPAVTELVSELNLLFSLNDGQFFKDMAYGIGLAVDAFNVLVRGITLACIGMEYLNALYAKDWEGAAAIKAKGEAYVAAYTAKDAKIESNKLIDASREGKTFGTSTGNINLSGGSGAASTYDLSDDVKTWNDNIVKRYGGSAEGYQRTADGVIKTDSTGIPLPDYDYAASQTDKSGKAVAGAGAEFGMNPGAFADTIRIIQYARENTDSNYQSEQFLQSIRALDPASETWGAGANWMYTNQNVNIAGQIGSLWQQYNEQKAGSQGYTQINYIQGDNAQQVANQIAEATSRALARQVSS